MQAPIAALGECDDIVNEADPDKHDLSTLAQRMRFAAHILEEATGRINGDLGAGLDWNWRPSELRNEAHHVEAEDRETAELEEQMLVLTGELLDLGGVGGSWGDVARKLIENGWRKEGSE
jgi:hypothetical protein